MSRRRGLKTRRRLALVAAAILAVMISLACGLAYAEFTTAADASADAALTEQAGILRTGLVEDGGRIIYTRGDLPRETPSGIAVAAAVVGQNDVLLETPNQRLSPSFILDLAQRVDGSGRPVWLTAEDARGVQRRVYAEPLPAAGQLHAVLVLYRSLRELQSDQQRLVAGLVLVGLLTTATGGALAHWLAGRALQPVRDIAGVARSLSDRDLSLRVETEVPDDELGDLVDTFNDMLGRLEGAFDGLRRFTADASHELRAPLTLMRTEIDVALARPRHAEEYVSTLRRLEAEVTHLTRLSEQLLIQARADAGVLGLDREPIDVADSLHELARRWTPAAQRRGVTLEVRDPDSGEVSADPLLLRQVLDNLVDNAIRHSPAGGRVRMGAAPAAGGWDFEVADEGPGIPPQARHLLFRRFGRLDAARSPGTGGAGLGLALSAAIAGAHGGRLSIADGSGPGAVFRLHLP